MVGLEDDPFLLGFGNFEKGRAVKLQVGMFVFLHSIWRYIISRPQFALSFRHEFAIICARYIVGLRFFPQESGGE